MNNLKIGKKILKLRKEKGMSQSDLAEQIDVSVKTISKWETGATIPSIDDLNKIAKKFDVSLDDLVMDNKKMVKDSNEKNKSHNKTFDLILVGASLACGIALVVTSIFKSVDVYSGFAMIGLGLTTIGLYLLRKIK